MPTFTTAQLEQRTWDGMDGNNLLYPEPNVRLVLNEGLRRLNLLVGWNTNIVSAGVTLAGQHDPYTVPAGIVVPLRIYLDKRELQKVSLRELGEQHRTWYRDTTANSGPVQRWIPGGITWFLLHPADAVGGRSLEIEGIVPVVPLVNQGDVVTLEDEWADVLIDYAKHRLMLKEGGKPFALASVAYQRLVSKLKGKVIWEGFRFPRYWIEKQLEPAEGKGNNN